MIFEIELYSKGLYYKEGGGIVRRLILLVTYLGDLTLRMLRNASLVHVVSELLSFAPPLTTLCI